MICNIYIYIYNSVEAFTNGINAYASEGHILPIEFQTLRTKFEKWDIADTIMIVKQTGLILSGYWSFILFRMGIADRVGTEWANRFAPYSNENFFSNSNNSNILNDEELKERNIYIEESPGDINWSYPYEIPKNINNSKNLNNSKKGSRRSEENLLSEYLLELDWSTENIWSGGSNAFAISGRYTKNGKPLLGGDPHLGNKIPSNWYLTVINLENQRISGATMMGVPFVYAGKNDYLAWTPTAIFGENIDLFQVIMNTNKTHYLYNKSWVKIKFREENIYIKGEVNSRQITIRECHQGPILEDIGNGLSPWLLFGTASFFNPNRPVAMFWDGFQVNDTTLLGGIRASLATNTSQFLDALKYIVTIPLGLVFATTDGDIGYGPTGSYHKRYSPHMAIYPKRGWEYAVCILYIYIYIYRMR